MYMESLRRKGTSAIAMTFGFGGLICVHPFPESSLPLGYLTSLPTPWRQVMTG